MTLPARRLDVPRRQDRLLPRQRAAVGFLDGGRRALPAVTHHAAKLVERVRHYRMPPKRLGADIGETGFFQPDVAGGAAIHDSELRQPDLLDSVVVAEVALQGNRIAPILHQRQILLLVVTPFAEVVLGGSYGQRDQ